MVTAIKLRKKFLKHDVRLSTCHSSTLANWKNTEPASGLHRKASDSGLLDLHFSNSGAGRNDKFRDLMFLFLKMFFLNLMTVILMVR